MNLSIFGSKTIDGLYAFSLVAGTVINLSTIFLEKAYRNDQSQENSLGKRFWKVFDYAFPCGTEQKSVFRFYSPFVAPIVSLIAKVIFVGFIVLEDIFLRQNGFMCVMKTQIPLYIIIDVSILYLPYKLKSIHDMSIMDQNA